MLVLFKKAITYITVQCLQLFPGTFADDLSGGLNLVKFPCVIFYQTP